MALKSYLPTITNITYGGADGPNTNILFAQVSGNVFENGTLLFDSSDVLVSSYGQGQITATSTLSSIKAAIQGEFASNFNLQTGRTDGNTIEFVWLDDKGIL